VSELQTTEPAPVPAWRRVDWLTLAGPYFGLALVVALFALLTWDRGRLHTFLSLDNLRLVSVHAAVIATVAVGMTLLMVSGGIDLSVGFVVSLVTVVTVLIYRFAVAQGLSPELASVCAITAGVGTGGLCGLGNGLLVTWLRIVPFVATLGMMGVARGVAQSMSGGNPVTFPNLMEPPAWVPWLRAIDPEPEWLVISPAAWSVLLLALIGGVLLHRTVFGKHCYAVGSNEATARLCGVRVERTKVIVYVLAGW